MRADAGADLATALAGLKDVKTLQADFVCMKQLQALDTPLTSSGHVWIQRGESGAAGSVRFTTRHPYVSEIILSDGKVWARSQHEEEWTKSNQSSRPGLTAVMGELGGWATGDASKLSDLYSVTEASAAIPPAPEAASTQPADAPAGQAATTFTLTPTNKDLAKSVKQIRIVFDPAAATLRFIEIVTEQGDMTRYWFTGVQKNAALPVGIFEPRNEPAPG